MQITTVSADTLIQSIGFNPVLKVAPTTKGSPDDTTVQLTAEIFCSAGAGVHTLCKIICMGSTNLFFALFVVDENEWITQGPGAKIYGKQCTNVCTN